MDNNRILNLTIKFKNSLRKEIEQVDVYTTEMKTSLWKILIMTEIAHRSFSLGINIEKFEKQYFDRYAAVARYFRDWGMDWVADNYFEIVNYTAAYYWPDGDKDGFHPNYVPFTVFQLNEF